jgi:magnesium chelatase family protein
LELLRQPLESGNVSIARAQQSVTFPAGFLLVAALNPCPCGYFGDKRRDCRCTKQQINQYVEKLSGPLLDRIDLQIGVQSIEYDTIAANIPEQSSAQLYLDVERAVQIQRARFGDTLRSNSSMSAEEIGQHCHLTPAAEVVVKRAFQALKLSMRGYHKVLKVARTVADMAGAENIDVTHVQEAVLCRLLDQSIEQQK